MFSNLRKLSLQKWDSLLSLVMRVPGLFVLDYCYQRNSTWSLQQDHTGWENVLTALITELVMVFGILLLILPLEAVSKFYSHTLSFSLLYLANNLSSYYIQLEASSTEVGVTYIKQQLLILVHIGIASIVAYLLGITSYAQRFLLTMHALPVVARLFGLNSPKDLETCHNFSTAFIILQGLFYICSLLPDILNYYSQVIVIRLKLMFELYGWRGMIINMWKQVFVPSHLLAFAIIQMSTFAVQRFGKLAQLSEIGLHFVFLSLISNTCFSPLSLVAESVFVSYIAYFTLLATKLFLRGQICSIILNDDNIAHSGYIECMAMMILSLQTNLILLKSPDKMFVTSVILFIVLSSLLQTIFDIVEPNVLELAATAHINKSHQNRWKRCRAIILCVFLLFCPSYLAVRMYFALPMDLWLMVIIFSCITTSIHALNLLITNGLYIYDAYTQVTPLEKFDDLIFILRAGIKALEFIIAVAVMCAGIFESFFITWDTFNSTILVAHGYLNVWLRFHSGWRTFVTRRDASKKIDSLPKATHEDLKNYEDVCAICYLQLKEARVTPCQHIFHGACLRKWLYMQDNCPMCHSSINITFDGISELVPKK